MGGTRFYPYPTAAAAVADVMDLSKAMAYKTALAGLDLGGGKAVIVGDPARDKSEQLLRAYGRFLQTLGGRYYTACDVGTDSVDMDTVARETRFATGRSTESGGAGDSSVLTARGVFEGMRAAAEHCWGSNSLEGRRVGIVGTGKVGRHLTSLLLETGAIVVATDISTHAMTTLKANHPAVQLLPSERDVLEANLDIYAPCALGGTVNHDILPIITARIICGAANNQLATPDVEEGLSNRGITYAPDYCVNAGGVIQVAEELEGFDFERAKGRTLQIYDRTLTVLRTAEQEGISTVAAADRIAERRMADVSRLKLIRTTAP